MHARYHEPFGVPLQGRVFSVHHTSGMLLTTPDQRFLLSYPLNPLHAPQSQALRFRPLALALLPRGKKKNERTGKLIRSYGWMNLVLILFLCFLLGLFEVLRLWRLDVMRNCSTVQQDSMQGAKKQKEREKGQRIPDISESFIIQIIDCTSYFSSMTCTDIDPASNQSQMARNYGLGSE
ncbi:hypothetical protein ACMFMG_001642 [Clarireedia jacksonii]